MSTILKGKTLVEQPMVCSWKIGTGGNTKRTFTGTATDINNQALYLQQFGYETEITTGPKWTLVATINIDLATNPESTTEPEPTPTWELVPHALEQNLYEGELGYQLPTEVKNTIESKVKNPNDNTKFIVPLEYARNATMVDRACRIYAMKQMGIDSSRIYTIALKRSIIVSSNYNLNWSIDNTNYVLSTNRVVSTYGVPNVLRSLLPDSSIADQNIPMTSIVANKYIIIPFYYGWLEQHPSYQFVGSNRIQISQEWIFNKWVASISTNTGLYKVLP